ncbi:hypothetical protein RHMOL_Rhmol13G0271300 [Rhododendron molle]|uniref:Uncharacterized protein n=1 Tax=Rhododendron molle TaxID=49168 RepID=A0ACC0LC58_RHOML|nr:hypothetical protein RHMOL_Rhmol13G0271300 [Rhododendron molle]
MTSHTTGIKQLQRAGVWLVLSAISMAIAGIVEVKRKNQTPKPNIFFEDFVRFGAACSSSLVTFVVLGALRHLLSKLMSYNPVFYSCRSVV